MCQSRERDMNKPFLNNQKPDLPRTALAHFHARYQHSRHPQIHLALWFSFLHPKDRLQQRGVRRTNMLPQNHLFDEDRTGGEKECWWSNRKSAQGCPERLSFHPVDAEHRRYRSWRKLTNVKLGCIFICWNITCHPQALVTWFWLGCWHWTVAKFFLRSSPKTLESPWWLPRVRKWKPL